MDRQNYLDNMRVLCILLLFPYHSAMCFSCFDKFYISGCQSKILSVFMIAVMPWWMSLLFVIAGISSFYSLKRRSAKQYLRQRAGKLLIPFLFGIIFTMPPQAYYADVFNNGYNGSFFSHYSRAFTINMNAVASDGIFMLGNLWFILYLLIFSIISLPLMAWYVKNVDKIRKRLSDFSLPVIIIIGFVLLVFLSLIGNFDKSIGGYFTCFLLGFLLLSNEKLIERLENKCGVLLAVSVVLIGLRVGAWLIGVDNDIYYYIEMKALEWVGVLTALGLGKKFIDKTNDVWSYLFKASFPVYLLHQFILVITAFYVVKLDILNLYQFLIITAVSLVVTFALYELLKRFRVTRFCLGIVKK